MTQMSYEKSWLRKELKNKYGITKHPLTQRSLKLHKASELMTIYLRLEDGKPAIQE